MELTRNESLHHIPIGLFNDLNDNVPDLNPNICDQDFLNCGPINDLANGFTDSQMFNLLDLSTDSPLIFKNRLIENVSLPVQDQVNNLFNSY